MMEIEDPDVAGKTDFICPDQATVDDGDATLMWWSRLTVP